MGFLKELFAPKKSAVQTAPVKPAYLTQYVIFGMHPYRQPGDDSSVYFVDEERGIRRMIVDSKGNIQNFPGIVKEAFWTAEVAPNYLKPQVGFRSSFEKRNNGWIFMWQVQPDGRYWADEDGFGGENDLEVTLYTYLDMDGNFSGPFRGYQLGNTGYAMDRFTGNHKRSQSWMLNAIREDECHRHCPSDLFPQLLGARTDHISDRFYQLHGKEEALIYWNDPVLSRDLLDLTQALLETPKSMWQIVGSDSRKVKGCMTLFSILSGEAVFQQVLDKYFGGEQDAFTVSSLQED